MSGIAIVVDFETQIALVRSVVGATQLKASTCLNLSFLIH